MSLITNQSEALVAEERIVCFKFFKKVHGKYISPYKAKIWQVGTVEHSNLIVKPVTKRSPFVTFNVITKGLHAYTNKTIPKIIAQSDPEKYVAFECIIPVGSFYFKSCRLEEREIVSDRMVMKKII